MKKIYIILFVAIIFLGIFLRFYRLGQVPNSLSWDEVSWGYNAYSILHSLRDEHGKFLPLSFQAFGDYKQPVYVYITSVAEFFMGLSAFSVRFPSAFFGSLTIPFVYLLVYEIFRKEKYKITLSFLAMLFFAISPWSIQFSRVAYEANVGLFFVISGAALFIRGLNIKRYYLNYIAILLLSISGFTYHSEKIFTPILFIGLLILAYMNFKVNWRKIIPFIVLFIICNAVWLVDSRTTIRGRSVTIFSNQTEVLKESTRDLIQDYENKDNFGKVFHNRRLVYLNQYLDNYLQHFNPNYLFLLGDNPRHHAYGMGVMYLISMPMIIFGIYKIDKRKYWFVFFWLLIAPVASALAYESPNASRSLVFLPTWHIFEAIGFISILFLKKNLFRYFMVSLMTVLLFCNFVYYLHSYFIHTNSEYGSYWQGGYSNVIEEIEKLKGAGKRIIFSEDFEQMYIFYLFYTKYDPSAYLSEGGSGKIYDKCFSIEKVYFGKCIDLISKGDYFVTHKQLSDGGFKKISVIQHTNKEVIGYLYESI